jgi:hypothetical protein
MSRESLSITITDTLRRAQVRQRLDTLAERTALAPTQIAGRALTIGLLAIESDLRRIFPDDAELSGAALAAAQPQAAEPTEAQPCQATHGADTQRAAQPSPPPPEAAPPRMVSTLEAARALGYREQPAFRQHCQRHPEIKKLSQKKGRMLLWNLPKLRSEFERQGWRPKR